VKNPLLIHETKLEFNVDNISKSLFRRLTLYMKLGYLPQHLYALVFLYAFEESVHCHLLSSFCDDSNLHISLFKHVLSTMGVSKESISKFLIGNRFHVKLRIVSPYSKLYLKHLFHESQFFFVATSILDVSQFVKMLRFMSLYYEIVVLSLFFLCCYFSLSTFHAQALLAIFRTEDAQIYMKSISY